jgi:hypothetical protein
MRTKNEAPRFATRLLQGARDLVWQDEPVLQRPAQTAGGDQEASASAQVSLAQPQADNSLTNELLSVVMSRPTAYSSLADAIAALADVPLDEATRYRSAYAVLKRTQQRTIDQIAQAIDVHISMLESEKVRFAAQSRHVEEEEIASRMAQVVALDDDMEAQARQIVALQTDTGAQVRRLQEEIARKQAHVAELKYEADQRRQAIARTKEDFDAAGKAVLNRLTREKSLVHQYLGQATQTSNQRETS